MHEDSVLPRVASCASTCETIRCDAGSTTGATLENRYSFRDLVVQIALKA
jgi:hypothetical protein